MQSNGLLRHPGGSIKQKPSESMSPAEVRRLAEQASLGLRDAVWSTQLGRIHLAGKVSALEFSAVGSPNSPPIIRRPASRRCRRARRYSNAPTSTRRIRTVKGVARSTPPRARHRPVFGGQARIADGGWGRTRRGSRCRPRRGAGGQVEFNALRAGLCALSTWWQSTRRKR